MSQPNDHPILCEDPNKPGQPLWYTQPIRFRTPPPMEFEEIFEHADQMLDLSNVIDPDQVPRKDMGQAPYRHLLTEAAQPAQIPAQHQRPLSYRYRISDFDRNAPIQLQNNTGHATRCTDHVPRMHASSNPTMVHDPPAKGALSGPAEHAQSITSGRPQNPTKHCRQSQPSIKKELNPISTSIPRPIGPIPAIRPKSSHNPNNPYRPPSPATYGLDRPPPLYWCRELNGGYSQRPLDEIENQLQPGYWTQSEMYPYVPIFARTAVEVEVVERSAWAMHVA